MKYLLITHTWFVNSQGFHVKQVDYVDEERIEELRIIEESKHTENMKYARTLVINLLPSFTINKGIKLTWWERITGRVKETRWS